MKNRTISSLSFILFCAGCPSSIYGEGSIYVWNGTEDTVDFIVEGRSPAEATLGFERGALFEAMVAGDYTITATRKGVPIPAASFTVSKDLMTVFNLDGVGCFARTDVSGMYKRGKAPVRVLEVYNKGERLIELGGPVPVKPGQRLPAEAPRLTREMVFQRFVVVPCDLIEDKPEEAKVAEFVRRLR